MAEPKVVEKRSKASRKPVKLIARIPGAKVARITGDFTQWSEEGIPLSKGPNGDWQADFLLAPGDHQYRLRVDGRWQDHAEARKRVPNQTVLGGKLARGRGGRTCGFSRRADRFPMS